MRIIVDLPPRIARQAAEVVEARSHGSLDDLIVEALTELFCRVAGPVDLPDLKKKEVSNVEPFATRIAGRTVYSRDPAAPWLWGMVNRVYPLKVAVRVCAEMARHGPVLLHALHAAFADRGQRIGDLLRDSDREEGLRRNEGRAVGFPSKTNDEQKARVRFAHQFVGRRSASGTYVGGAFETGLIGVTELGSDWVAPTELGWEFAEMQNELLDRSTVTERNLGESECRFYLDEIARSVPAERNAFSAILGALSAGPLDAAALASRLRPHQRLLLPEAVRDTSRSGALARLADVGGIARKPLGRSASYEVTALGAEATEWLGANAAVG
jgi:hypothetical protein